MALRVDSNPCNEDITDLLAAFLADADYETFEPDETGLTAYVRKDKYDGARVKEILEEFPMDVDFSVSTKEIKGEDWNREWEQNYFKPIIIGDKVLVRSSFHEGYPEAELEIVIDPKMAFGTGHHSTTSGMIKLLLENDIRGKSVIDMGTGTGILGIICKKLGSARTVGIDIDEFALENAKENGELNEEDIEWMVGDDGALKDLDAADIFLANINLNVITENLDKYLEKLNPGGLIFLSGFLDSDREKILDLAVEKNLIPIKGFSENHWEAIAFRK